MGTWGPGNFQNDGALDYLSEIVGQLVRNITDAFKGTKADPDELGDSVLMPSVAILAVLCEHCNAHLPQKDRIREWKRKYLQNWDSHIDELDPKPDYKLRRREVISATFDRLEELASA